MKRHVIIGRFGAGDRVGVETTADERATRLDFVNSNKHVGHGIGEALNDLAMIGISPTEIGVDMLVLAAHVHAADTRISRATESQDSWTRELRLVVPVSDVARWNEAVPTLQRTLNFLTGDRWILSFRLRPNKFRTVVPVKREGVSVFTCDKLALFSGGLDSLIGAIDVLESGSIPLFISHAGEGATSYAQNTLIQALKCHYGQNSLGWLRIWINFSRNLVRNVGTENTTRGRSFLFFAAGVLAGTGFRNGFTLRVPENGLIALNIPLDPLRLGALSTRTTHPFYMARWNDLLKTLGIPGRIENPYWYQTKGEMVAGCANRELLAKLVPASLSCSSPTKGRWQGQKTGHCGFCLPCLIRRAALLHGLGASDQTLYTLDIAAKTLNTELAEGQQARSFQYALERVRRNPYLAQFLIHKPGPLSDESVDRQALLVNVYLRGLEEVGKLLAGVSTKPA